MRSLPLDRKLSFLGGSTTDGVTLHRRSLSGPVRTKPARGGAGKASKGPAKRKQPKTAEELDKELDAFMGDADGASTNDSTAVAVGSEGTAAIAAGNGDVDMV